MSNSAATLFLMKERDIERDREIVRQADKNIILFIFTQISEIFAHSMRSSTCIQEYDAMLEHILYFCMRINRPKGKFSLFVFSRLISNKEEDIYLHQKALGL